MQKYQHFVWLLIAAVLQANVANGENNFCERWELKKKTESSAGAADNQQPDTLLMDAASKLTQPGQGTSDFPDILTKYFQENSSTFAPSFLLFVILLIAILPMWIMCGCCEGCWFKRCRQDHASKVVPCIYWIIWLVSVVVLAAVVISAQTAFQRFSTGISGSVCDVDGSMGKVADWIVDISNNVDGLTKEIGTIIDEGQGDVTRTIDDLQATINTSSSSLSSVLDNIVKAVDVIKANFTEYNIQFEIPGFENLKQQSNLDSQVNFDGIKFQLGDYVTQAKDIATTVPRIFAEQLRNMSASVRVTREKTFSSGDITLPAIPYLFPNGLEQATLKEASQKGTGAVQQLVLLMYIPIFLCAPPLLIGGVLIMAFFCFCHENKCYKGALCGSKFGCCLLHVGLFFILILSIPFLALTLLYNDTCLIGKDPVVPLRYFEKQGSLSGITNMLQDNNFTKNMDILETAEQCLAGSAYNGEKTLASRLGLSGIISDAIGNSEKTLEETDTADLGKFVDEAFDKARVEIKSFKGQAEGRKMPQELISKADNSCKQCASFKDTFDSFTAEYGGEDMKSYGEDCDEVCSSSPAEGCASYSTTTTNPLAQPSQPNILTVVNDNGQRKIEFPDGTRVSVPNEIADKVQAGENDPTAPCRMCKEKVCSLLSLGGTINQQIDVIYGELNSLEIVVNDTATKIKTIQDGMLTPIKNLFGKAKSAILKAMDKIDCAVIGDIYYTVYSSVCTEGANGFTAYAWYFVWSAFFGLVVIITTILLNLCVGLRPLDENGKERDLPDYPGIEMGNKGLGDAYASSPGPEFQPEIPTAVHVQTDDKGQYIM